MKIYWTLKSIPELRDASRSERRRRWRRVNRKAFNHITTWAALILCALCGGFGAYYGQIAGSGVLGAALGGGIGGFMFSQVSIAVVRKHYRPFLLGKESEPTDCPHA